MTRPALEFTNLTTKIENEGAFITTLPFIADEYSLRSLAQKFLK